jgi:hypothetical protein
LKEKWITYPAEELVPAIFVNYGFADGPAQTLHPAEEPWRTSSTVQWEFSYSNSSQSASPTSIFEDLPTFAPLILVVL